jgi:pimeloyl-ACP methyl ester carboxylesterase
VKELITDGIDQFRAQIPNFDLGGSGFPMHFLHANGYPPSCYKPLLELLHTRYHVFGMMLRPLWPHSNMQDLDNWHPLSLDLLKFLANRTSEPVIGIGHSIGGIVTLRAALRAADKFRALILVDPVLFVPPILIGWRFARALGLGGRIHPKIMGALNRRRTFDDLDTVFRGYRGRKVFRYLSDEGLWAYIHGITKEMPTGQFELVYSPDWEAHIYYTGLDDADLWHGLPELRIPTLILRGAETDTFLDKAAQLVRKKQPQVRIVTLERSTHLLPLERPAQVIEIVHTFLKEIR